MIIMTKREFELQESIHKYHVGERGGNIHTVFSVIEISAGY